MPLPKTYRTASCLHCISQNQRAEAVSCTYLLGKEEGPPGAPSSDPLDNVAHCSCMQGQVRVVFVVLQQGTRDRAQQEGEDSD